MLKTLLSFILSFTALMLSAQLSITIEPNPVHGSGDASNPDIKAVAMVVNTSDQDVALHWRREVVEAPEEWLSWVCDTRACYDPSFDASPSVNPNNLGPNDTMAFEVHVRPNDIDGIAQLQFEIYDASDPNTVLGVVQSTFETSTTGIRDISNTGDLRIYPNPSSAYFRIYRSEAVDRVAIYTIVGTPVMEFQVVEDGRYDISDLPEAMYFARLIGHHDEVLKTVRLSKR